MGVCAVLAACWSVSDEWATDGAQTAAARGRLIPDGGDLPPDAIVVRSSGSATDGKHRTTLRRETRLQAALAAPATVQRAGAACAFVVAASVIVIAMVTVGFGPVPQSPSELGAWNAVAKSPLALLNATVVIGAGFLVPVVLALSCAWAAQEMAAATTCLGFTLIRTRGHRWLGVVGFAAAASQLLLTYAWCC